MKYEVRKNEQYNSNEVYFDGKPSVEVRENLKGLRMRWNSFKKCWYGFVTEEQIADAINGKVETKAVVKKPAEKKNKFGVKVGDMFYASWGYDQTNINIFQVVGLVGEQSVRVREVCPTIAEEDGIGFMSRNVSFNVTNDLLPADDYSVFIKNQKDGDIKRIQKSKWDGGLFFKLDTFANAYPYDGQKLYNSWYA